MIDPRRSIAVLLACGYALAAALILFVWILYDELPEMVAIDFGPDGQPVIGSKEKLLTPLSLMIGVGVGTAALITVITVFRHTIVEKYPYLINLPALTMVLGRIADRDARRQYVDRLFVPIAIASIMILDLIAVIAMTVLSAARTYTFNASMVIGLVLILSGAYCAGVLLYYRSIYREIRAKVVT